MKKAENRELKNGRRKTGRREGGSGTSAFFSDTGS